MIEPSGQPKAPIDLNLTFGNHAKATRATCLLAPLKRGISGGDGPRILDRVARER